MNHLKIQHLTLRIANKTICENLNIDIVPGTVWGILGQNGSGKTTLLHALAGLYPFQQGEIYLAQKKLSQYSIKERARLIGILFQENHSDFQQTVWEYCLTGRYPHAVSFLQNEQDHQKTHDALKNMQLDHLRSRNISMLSGGERRRLAIATLLAQSPFLYLLDEPFNHLDMRHQMKIIHYFRQQTQNNQISIILALHDINIAQHFCDYLLMLFGNGKILAGTKTDLLTEEHLSELYGHPVRCSFDQENKWWTPESLFEENSCQFVS